MGNRVMQARINSQEDFVSGQGILDLALFDQDGEPVVLGDAVSTATTSTAGIVKKTIAVANIATADATDEASAVILANANKAKINALLAALRTAGIVTP